MKIIKPRLWIGLVLCIWSATYAEPISWKVRENSDQEFEATRSDLPGISVTFLSSGGTPKFLREEKPVGHPDLIVIHYESGEAGTTALYRILRASVVNVKTKEVLLDEVTQYQPLGARKLPPLDQPTWKWEKTKLIVTDPVALHEQVEIKIP